MTHQALYVVVHDGTWWHAVHNIGAYETDQVLALGAEASRAYLGRLRAFAATDKLLGAGNHAGALLDSDARVLLTWTEMLSYPGHRAYLAALRAAWPHWEIRWAFDGAFGVMTPGRCEVGGLLPWSGMSGPGCWPIWLR